MKTTKTRTYKTMFGPRLVLTAGLALMAFLTVPAAAQYQIYDLNVAGWTQDIQTDNTDAVHLIWTSAEGGSLYYSRIVNNAIAGQELIGSGIDTHNWLPFVSVRPDGSTVHVAWTTSEAFGNSLKHSWRDGTGWHTELILKGGSKQWLSQSDCVVDSSGVVHVMFCIWNNDTADPWATMFYVRKSAAGTWGSVQQFATYRTPELEYPMLCTDSQGNVHATWILVGKIGGDSFDAYYRTVPSGGTLMVGTTYKIPKGPNIDVNGLGDIYVDHNGVVHRSIQTWSEALQKLAIDHSKKLPGGQFSVPTRPSLDFFSGLKNHVNPVPAVVAGEDGRVIVAWGQVMATGANMVKASFYDPETRRWSIDTIDPAAGVPALPNAYRVALTRNNANMYGVWRARDGHIHLFVLPTGPTLQVISPNGGEKWRAGSTQNITWNQGSLTGNVTIELYKNGQKTADVGTAAAAAGTFEWSIPSGTTLGTDYKVRVYQGSVEDFSNANFQIVAASTPEIALAPDSLVFGALSSGAKTQDQKVFLSNVGGGSLNWGATASNSWITVSPKTGTGDALLAIGVNPVGLGVGVYNGTVSVTDSNAANSPQTIAVKLNVLQSGGLPFGVFDTPTNWSTVRGSIPVTGWALDDIEVTRVEIRRGPVTGDPAGAIGADGLIYVGDATFVEGARPDIETTYPGFPLNYRAGWGYMLLTYGLPDKGNGTFVLHAVAFDREGHRSELGTKTIVADNAHNTKPFGAIDTPGQGATVSGNSYVNFGWVLTPPPAMVPIDGSTIWLWIDGVQVGHPTYNELRTDVHDAYPDYLNADGAGGYYTINTTVYANGMHTIGWSATDDHSQAEGMGSRFFWVFNGSSSVAGLGALAASDLTGAQDNTAKSEARNGGLVSNLPSGIPPSTCLGRLVDLAGMAADVLSPAYVRRGFRDAGTYEVMNPDARGVRNYEIEEVERIVMALDSPDELPSGGREEREKRSSNRDSVELTGAIRWSGYLVVGNELRPLPIGSTLDPRCGVFYWQPGPGFFGQYDFVFIKQDSGRFSVKSPVTVRILPRGTPNL